MRLFISADIEGVSGVTNNEQSSSTGRLYAEAGVSEFPIRGPFQ